MDLDESTEYKLSMDSESVLQWEPFPDLPQQKVEMS